MRRIWIMPLGLLMLGLTAWAADDKKAEPPKPVADPPKAEKPKTPKEEYGSLMKEYQAAQSTYQKAYLELRAEVRKKTDKPEEQFKLLQEEIKKRAIKEPDRSAFGARFFKLAATYPRDPVAREALISAVSMDIAGPQAEKAMALLAKDHLGNVKLAQLFRVLPLVGSEAGEKLLRDALAKSPNREVRGRACLGLAELLKRRGEVAVMVREGKEEVRGSAALIGEEALKKLKIADLAAIAREKEEYYERVVKEYGDIKDVIDLGFRKIDRGTLGEQAGAELFEIRYLAVGKAVPDIEGEDLDGKPFKLSDYRGKVVVLDFWGNW